MKVLKCDMVEVLHTGVQVIIKQPRRNDYKIIGKVIQVIIPAILS